MSFENDDYFIKHISDYIKDGNTLCENDIITILNFLAVFSIGCRRLELNTLAERFSNRLSMFVRIIEKAGYKYGKRSSGKKELGLGKLYSSAFYNLKLVE